MHGGRLGFELADLHLLAPLTLVVLWVDHDLLITDKYVKTVARRYRALPPSYRPTMGHRTWAGPVDPALAWGPPPGMQVRFPAVRM